jgi:hypothetical protein
MSGTRLCEPHVDEQPPVVVLPPTNQLIPDVPDVDRFLFFVTKFKMSILDILDIHINRLIVTSHALVAYGESHVIVEPVSGLKHDEITLQFGSVAQL